MWGMRSQSHWEDGQYIPITWDTQPDIISPIAQRVHMHVSMFTFSLYPASFRDISSRFGWSFVRSLHRVYIFFNFFSWDLMAIVHRNVLYCNMDWKRLGDGCVSVQTMRMKHVGMWLRVIRETPERDGYVDKGDFYRESALKKSEISMWQCKGEWMSCWRMWEVIEMFVWAGFCVLIIIVFW